MQDSQSTHNDKFSLQQWKATIYVVKVQSKNRSASEIESSFNCHEVLSTHILQTAFDSITLKENECWSIECLFENSHVNNLLYKWQEEDQRQSDWDHLHTTKDYHFISKIINLSKRFLKSELHWNNIKLRRLRIEWKMQSTLNVWNKYLRYNDHKNKIIREIKRTHFRTQMHKLSDLLK